jgi:hypothetical protein
MMKNEIENQKRKSRRDERETTIKRIAETKAIPENEASGAQQK